MIFWNPVNSLFIPEGKPVPFLSAEKFPGSVQNFLKFPLSDRLQQIVQSVHFIAVKNILPVSCKEHQQHPGIFFPDVSGCFHPVLSRHFNIQKTYIQLPLMFLKPLKKSIPGGKLFNNQIIFSVVQIFFQ